MSITVSGCFIYPLKSGSATRVAETTLSPLGADYDRRWMLVRDSGSKRGHFITQRQPGCERLAVVQANVSTDAIRFTRPHANDLLVSVSDYAATSSAVKVWKDWCPAFDAGDEAAAWFSEFLSTPCRLVKFDESAERPADPRFCQPGDVVSFADGMPLLITNEASLDALNSNITGSPVDMARFRPNIVLRGARAFEEDVIHTARIGDVLLEFTHPCTRCVIPSINQQTGERDSQAIIDVLSTNRRGQSDDVNGVLFGQNAVARKIGTIRTGESIQILETKPAHPSIKHCKLAFDS